MHYFLRNYKMNAKIHHLSVRLHVLGRTMQEQLPTFTFIALNSRRLWCRWSNFLESNPSIWGYTNSSMLFTMFINWLIWSIILLLILKIEKEQHWKNNSNNGNLDRLTVCNRTNTLINEMNKHKHQHTLRLNTDYIKKFSKEKLFRIKFSTKNTVGTYVFLSPKWS